jgi:hypothetical protein
MKKAFYIFCTTVLGILISFIVLGLLERAYLAQSLANGNYIPLPIDFLGISFYLPFVVVYFIFTLGAVGGVTVGFHWWQYVYVDKLCKRTRDFRDKKNTRNISSGKKHKVTKSTKVTKISKTSKVTKKKVAAKTKKK